MLFLVLEIADLIRAEKESCGSRIIPKCLCSLNFLRVCHNKGLLDDLFHAFSSTAVARQLAFVNLD